MIREIINRIKNAWKALCGKPSAQYNLILPKASVMSLTVEMKDGSIIKYDGIA